MEVVERPYIPCAEWTEANNLTSSDEYLADQGQRWVEKRQKKIMVLITGNYREA